VITQFQLIFYQDFFRRIFPYIEEKRQKNSLKTALKPCSTCISAYHSLFSKRGLQQASHELKHSAKHFSQTLTKAPQTLPLSRLSMFISPHGGASSGGRSREFFALYLNKWID